MSCAAGQGGPELRLERDGRRRLLRRLPACVRDGLTLPVTRYSHASGDGCTIIGGYVYRGYGVPGRSTGALPVRRLLLRHGSGCCRHRTRSARGRRRPRWSAGSTAASRRSARATDGELYAVDLNGRILQAGRRRPVTRGACRGQRHRSHARTMPGCAGPSHWQPSLLLIASGCTPRSQRSAHHPGIGSPVGLPGRAPATSSAPSIDPSPAPPVAPSSGPSMPTDPAEPPTCRADRRQTPRRPSEPPAQRRCRPTRASDSPRHPSTGTEADPAPRLQAQQGQAEAGEGRRPRRRQTRSMSPATAPATGCCTSSSGPAASGS